MFAIDVDGGDLELRPAHSHSLTGGSLRSAWRYDLTLAGPSVESVRESLPAAAVVHCMYAHSSGTPWVGVSPIVAASLAGRLSAETTKALADESSGAVGQLVPIPVGRRRRYRGGTQGGPGVETRLQLSGRGWRLGCERRRSRRTVAAATAWRESAGVNGGIGEACER